MYLTFRWEAEADCYSRVFLERYFHFLNKAGKIPDEKPKDFLDYALWEFMDKAYLPRHKKKFEDFMGILAKQYKNFCDIYAKIIDAALEETLGKRAHGDKYSFEILS